MGEFARAILYLEGLIHEKHRSALAYKRPPIKTDLKPIETRIDSLQKQIDRLKTKVNGIKGYIDIAQKKDELISKMAKQAKVIWGEMLELIEWLKSRGYFKEGELRALREAGFMTKPK